MTVTEVPSEIWDYAYTAACAVCKFILTVIAFVW